jgi:hypothetical protein
MKEIVKWRIELFPISSSGCVQCAFASPIAPKGKSALVKQNLFGVIIFYFSLVFFVNLGLIFLFSTLLVTDTCIKRWGLRASSLSAVT